MVLVAEQFAIPSQVFFSAELQLTKFWAGAETKTVFCLGRITAEDISEEKDKYEYNVESE